MKASLGQHGRRLPRYRPNDTELHQHKLERAVRETPAAEPTHITPAGGDKRQLRGIPVIGATTGATPGSDPVQALLDQEPDEPRATRQPLGWLRAWVIDRDRSICYLCGLECWPHEIHIDHVIPVSRGGDNHPNNLRVACSTCNLRKHNKLPDDPPPIRYRLKRPVTPIWGRRRYW